MHGTCAGDEGREGAYDRNKPRNDDRLAAIFLEEPMGTVQMFALDQAWKPAREPLTGEMPDPVIDGLTEHRRDDEQRDEKADIQAVVGGEGSRSEEERIAWQHRCDHQARLTKDDHEKNRVDPGTVL